MEDFFSRIIMEKPSGQGLDDEDKSFYFLPNRNIVNDTATTQ